MDGFLPGATFGRYRIEGIVGRGGMASVYRATETALERQVALKVVLGPSATGARPRGTRSAGAPARAARDAGLDDGPVGCRQEWTIEAPPVDRESCDAELARSYRALGPLGTEHARATACRLGVHHGPLWVATHVDPAPTILPFSPGSPSPVTANRG